MHEQKISFSHNSLKHYELRKIKKIGKKTVKYFKMKKKQNKYGFIDTIVHFLLTCRWSSMGGV